MSEDDIAARPSPLDAVICHPAWLEALEQLREALSVDKPVVALLGPPGMGKTWVLRALHREMREAGRASVLLERGDAETPPEHRPDLVLVDEADRVGPAMLLTLAKAGVRTVVLAALPSFAQRLSHVPGALVVHLRSLGDEEARAFLHARAEALGTAGWLSEEAAAEIVAISAGVPRLLDLTLQATCFVAGVHDAERVLAEHVREAVYLRGDLSPPSAEPMVDEPAIPVRELFIPAPPASDPRQEAAAPPPAAPSRRRRRVMPLLVAGAGACAMLVGVYVATRPSADVPGEPQAPATVAPSPAPPQAASVASAGSGKSADAPVVEAPTAEEPGREPQKLADAPPPLLDSPESPLEPAAVIPPESPSMAEVAVAEPPPTPAPMAAAELAADQPRDAAAAPPTAQAPEPSAPERSVSEPSVSESSAPEPSVPEPGSIAPHVVITYEDGDATAEHRSAEAMRALRDAGVVTGDPIPVSRRLNLSAVSYFFAEDARAAAQVSRVLGPTFGDGRAVTIPASAPPPRPGTIQVQVASPDKP